MGRRALCWRSPRINRIFINLAILTDLDIHFLLCIPSFDTEHWLPPGVCPLALVVLPVHRLSHLSHHNFQRQHMKNKRAHSRFLTITLKLKPLQQPFPSALMIQPTQTPLTSLAQRSTKMEDGDNTQKGKWKIKVRHIIPVESNTAVISRGWHDK